MLVERQNVTAGDKGRDTIPVLSAILGVSWIAVLLRIYTRLHIVKRFHSEDWLILISVIIFSAYCGCVITTSALVSLGGDQSLSTDRLLMTLEFVIASEVFYIAALLVLKLSIGLFFLRFTAKEYIRYSVLFVMVISTSFSVAMILFVVFQCGSFVGISEFVAKRLAGQCVQTGTLLGLVYAHGGVTALTDWIYVVIPFFIVHGTSMSRKEKIAIGTLMAFASAGAIAAIVRFIYIPSLTVPITTYFKQSAPISIWSGIEPGVGIVAASIICLRPMLRHHFGLSLPKDAQNNNADSSSSMSIATSKDPFASSESESRVALKDYDDQQLDWRSASAVNTESGRNTPNWPLSVTPESGTREQPAEKVEIMLERPLRTRTRASPTYGLPLEVFGKHESRTRDSWV